MTITATAIVSDTMSGGTRQVMYQCTDHNGKTWKYGSVFCLPSFDAEAHKTVVAERVAHTLAENEARALLEG